jgi:hypothetical protein
MTQYYRVEKLRSNCTRIQASATCKCTGLLVLHEQHSLRVDHVVLTGQCTTFSRSLTGQSSGKRENDETFQVQDCVLFALLPVEL